jgi:HK97 gp10 family phage protein
MALDFNFGDLEQKLNNLSRKVSNELTDKALQKGGDVVLNEMSENVPVDTGFLKSRIDTKFKGSNINRKIDVGILNNKDRAATYGYYQEHGTRRMIGKKWMKKSWQKSIKEASDEISKVVVNEILK